jgi:molecular chaperone GrpE
VLFAHGGVVILDGTARRDAYFSRPKRLTNVTTDNDGIRSKPENGGTESSAKTADESKERNAAEPAGGQAGSELEALRGERDKLRDQMLRTAADFDNFRKRARRDIDEARQRSRSDLIRELLPVFDGLELAQQTAGGTSDLGSVIEGVRMVLKLFEDAAKNIGLARVPALGERFDPAVHEAIQQVETTEQAPGTVLAQVKAGYRFGERLVRPAMVVVARKPAAAAQAASSDAASDESRPSSTEHKDPDQT